MIRRLALSLSIVGMLPAAAMQPSGAAGGPSIEVAENAAGETYHGSGTVTGVRPPGGITIDGPIDGLMDSMNMDYKVKSPDLFRHVRVGDTIRFDVDGAYTVLGVTVLKRAK